MKIVYDADAQSMLKKLPRTISKRILNKLEQTMADLHHYFEKLTGRTEYKLRVGNYRVIAFLSQEMIYVWLVDHRKRIYKKL
jgi:mRNA interferase RelE/StbE